LGGGSFGIVYKGYDNEQKRFIAVKQIPRANLYGLPQGELKEITIMRKLNHPNIMQYYGSSGDRTAPEGIFMFLELCEGGTIGNLIASKLTELRAYELFKQLTEGMAYMNEQST
jgi:serine/threonine protein kinase